MTKRTPSTKAACLSAVEELRECDHQFLDANGVAKFAKAFGLEGQIKPYKAKANPEDPKGLTFYDGRSEGIGMDAAILAQRICGGLGVKYAERFGRGSQLASCCDALEKYYRMK